jgi:DNA-binding transcriptional regulator YiaG
MKRVDTVEGNLIKQVAARCAVTVADLARSTGIPRQTIIGWQRGRLSPTGRALMMILLELGPEALLAAKPTAGPASAAADQHGNQSTDQGGRV